MQSVSSRIWTRVAMSISYNDNHYTTGTLHYKVWIKGKEEKSMEWSTALPYTLVL